MCGNNNNKEEEEHCFGLNRNSFRRSRVDEKSIGQNNKTVLPKQKQQQQTKAPTTKKPKKKQQQWGLLLFLLNAAAWTIVCHKEFHKEFLLKAVWRDNDDVGEETKNNNDHQNQIGIIEELYQSVNAKRLSKIARDHGEAYSHAEPFPHIVIDGIFPIRFLEAVSKEIPEEGKGMCFDPQKCHRASEQNLKSFVNDENDMGFHTKIFLAFLKSSTWVKFLQELTGIPHILPDPHYSGSGLHVTGSGGNLDIHADFNHLKGPNLERRVNTFVYMNQDWPDSYGGHLELWGRDMGSCYRKILPIMGRFVVFSTTDFTYHGHPQPQTSPGNRFRRSIALYYYTNGRPLEECENKNCSSTHSTLFQKPRGCAVCEEATCKRYNNSAPYWVDA